MSDDSSTTDGRVMKLLIGALLLATTGGTGYELVSGDASTAEVERADDKAELAYKLTKQRVEFAEKRIDELYAALERMENQMDELQMLFLRRVPRHRPRLGASVAWRTAAAAPSPQPDAASPSGDTVLTVEDDTETDVRPGCASDVGCAEGQRCDTATGTCRGQSELPETLDQALEEGW